MPPVLPPRPPGRCVGGPQAPLLLGTAASPSGNGVGDDACSWAYDGIRNRKWHDGQDEPYGEYRRPKDDARPRQRGRRRRRLAARTRDRRRRWRRNRSRRRHSEEVCAVVAGRRVRGCAAPRTARTRAGAGPVRDGDGAGGGGGTGTGLLRRIRAGVGWRLRHNGCGGMGGGLLYQRTRTKGLVVTWRMGLHKHNAP